MPPKRTQSIAIRIAPEELEEIDRRAKAKQLSRTDFIVRAALGILDVDAGAVETEIADMKVRLARLEDFAFSG